MHNFKTLAAVMVGCALLASGPVFSMAGAPDPVGKSRNYLDGERAVKAKEYAKAVPLLERALNDNLRDADTNNLLGYSHRKLGNAPTALVYYQRALQIDPNHKGANEYLGELYVEMKDLPKADERLQKLAQVCGTSCEEYRDLKAAIDEAKASA